MSNETWHIQLLKLAGPACEHDHWRAALETVEIFSLAKILNIFSPKPRLKISVCWGLWLPNVLFWTKFGLKICLTNDCIRSHSIAKVEKKNNRQETYQVECTQQLMLTPRNAPQTVAGFILYSQLMVLFQNG